MVMLLAATENIKVPMMSGTLITAVTMGRHAMLRRTAGPQGEQPTSEAHHELAAGMPSDASAALHDAWRCMDTFMSTPVSHASAQRVEQCSKGPPASPTDPLSWGPEDWALLPGPPAPSPPDHITPASLSSSFTLAGGAGL